MHRKRRLLRPALPNLFTPLPQRPTWGSLSPALTQRVLELLAELLRAPSLARRPRAARKEDSHE